MELIKQPYALTVAKYSYSINETRILKCVMRMINKDHQLIFSRVVRDLWGNQCFRIHPKDIVGKSKNRKQIKDAVRGLMKKTIVFNGLHVDGMDGECDIYENLVSSAIYERSTGIITIGMSNKLLSVLSLLKRKYTRCAFRMAFETSSSYAVRLYDFVAHYRDNKVIPSIFIDEIKAYLGIRDKYARPAAFLKMVLKPAIEEMKKHADVWFSISSPIKKGKKVVGWNIKIHVRGEDVKVLSPLSIERYLVNYFGFKATDLEEVKHIINNESIIPRLYAKLKKLNDYVKSKKIEHVHKYVKAALMNEFGTAQYLVGENVHEALSPDEIAILSQSR